MNITTLYDFAAQHAHVSLVRICIYIAFGCIRDGQNFGCQHSRFDPARASAPMFIETFFATFFSRSHAGYHISLKLQNRPQVSLNLTAGSNHSGRLDSVADFSVIILSPPRSLSRDGNLVG